MAAAVWRQRGRANRTACVVVAVLGLPTCPARAAAQGGCSPKFQAPADAPLQALDYNGVRLQDVCISSAPPHSVFIVGDWGGLVSGPGQPPVPADKRSKLFVAFQRPFVTSVDDRAQLLVAKQMRIRAADHDPDYVLNVGDNFYWGGVNAKCGTPPFQTGFTSQWRAIYESVYYGSGLDNKPWLGVLGNHDWGGYHFTAGWDQAIAYTWSKEKYSTGRWITPALYWVQKVSYPNSQFSVEYFFVDTNFFEAWEPDENPSHNICSREHSEEGDSCGAQGPRTVEECHLWFTSLWEKQAVWLEQMLELSSADWQIIVTHMPPKFGVNEWACFAERYGIDLFVCGHIHYQKVLGAFEEDNPLGATAVVISGGGGGITSEYAPDAWGEDDSYGFVHLTLSSSELQVEAITHSGKVRKSVKVKPRLPNKDRPQCAQPPAAEHFVAAEGGSDRACRGEDDGNKDAHFQLLEYVPSLTACQRHCHATPLCCGIEYASAQKVCELWVVPVVYTVPMPGVVCMRTAPGGQPDEVPGPVPPAPPKAVAGGFGAGRACRGITPRRPSDFQLHAGVPSVTACERLCVGRGTSCHGVEYGPRRSCRLWVKPIRDSVHKKGVACLPNHVTHPEGARAAEVPVDVVSIAV